VRILVTGGTGFLGQHLVPLLVAQGHQVRVLGRTEPVGMAGVEFVKGDLKDRQAVRGALVGVETVYHLAGAVLFDPKEARKMYELHVAATRELLRDIREAGIGRLILASTSGTIAVSKQERLGTEADDYPIEVVGRWPYYLSKIYEEKLTLEFCRRHAIPLVVLNPSLLLGPGDERLSSTWTVSKFLQGDIPSMPNGGLSFVDVRDAAAAFAQALTCGEVGGRHLLGVNMSFAEFFGRLSRMTGVPQPPLRLPGALNVLGGRLLERWAKYQGKKAALPSHEVEIAEHFFYLDASKAQRELGFEPRDAHQTLYDTVQFILSRTPQQSWPGQAGRLFETRKGT
jgi:dihydroflavonol-4-reductase